MTPARRSRLGDRAGSAGRELDGLSDRPRGGARGTRAGPPPRPGLARWGVQNQPLPRALGQLALDLVHESPRMVPVALPDYLRFGPVIGLRLFHELTRFPSLERLLHTPVPTLAVLGGRDPLMPSPPRVHDVGRLAPQSVAVAVVERAAHAVNFSHPLELAQVIESWPDGALADGARLPAGVRMVHPRRMILP